MIGKLSAEQTIIDNDLKFGAKDSMNLVTSRFAGVEKDITLSVSKEYADIIRAEVTQNWESLSFMNILHMVMTMTDEERSTVEEFAAKLLELRPKDNGESI